MRAMQPVMAALLSLAATSVGAQHKVEHHINDATAPALAALRNVRNHLDTDPTAKVTAIADGFGVNFMPEDAKDRNGVPIAATVSALVNPSVRFEVCESTLKLRD